VAKTNCQNKDETRAAGKETLAWPAYMTYGKRVDTSVGLGTKPRLLQTPDDVAVSTHRHQMHWKK